ncbi:MAG: hypothetical protein K2N18_03080, partial [Clostridia bacterium]|nr:hypothetical protein [Clostridia bacterium]
VANVQPFIARPLDLAMLIIGLLIVVVAISAVTVICLRNKKAKQAVLIGGDETNNTAEVNENSEDL